MDTASAASLGCPFLVGLFSLELRFLLGFSDLGLQSSNRPLDIHRGQCPTDRVFDIGSGWVLQKIQDRGSASDRVGV